MRWRQLLTTGVAAATLLAACSGDGGDGDAAGSRASDQGTETVDDDDGGNNDGNNDAAGPRVPDRVMETFDGGELALTDLAGQPLVVNLWASWCPPCVAEMPDLERVHRDRGDEVRFVGINTQDDLAEARQLVADTGVTYDLTSDPDGAMFTDLEVVAMPTTLLVDADGVIVHRHAGLLTEAQLVGLIDEHLAG